MSAPKEAGAEPVASTWSRQRTEATQAGAAGAVAAGGAGDSIPSSNRRRRSTETRPRISVARLHAKLPGPSHRHWSVQLGTARVWPAHIGNLI